jgi:hypothetical protein
MAFWRRILAPSTGRKKQGLQCRDHWIKLVLTTELTLEILCVTGSKENIPMKILDSKIKLKLNSVALDIHSINNVIK